MTISFRILSPVTQKNALVPDPNLRAVMENARAAGVTAPSAERATIGAARDTTETRARRRDEPES